MLGEVFLEAGCTYLPVYKPGRYFACKSWSAAHRLSPHSAQTHDRHVQKALAPQRKKRKRNERRKGPIFFPAYFPASQGPKHTISVSTHLPVSALCTHHLRSAREPAEQRYRRRLQVHLQPSLVRAYHHLQRPSTASLGTNRRTAGSVCGHISKPAKRSAQS